MMIKGVEIQRKWFLWTLGVLVFIAYQWTLSETIGTLIPFVIISLIWALSLSEPWKASNQGDSKTDGSQKGSRDWSGHIFDSLTEGLIVVSTDGIILAVNKALKDMLGYDEVELINRPFSEIYKSVRSERVHGFFQKQHTHKEEFQFRTHDGGSIPVRFSNSLLHDEEREIVGSIGLVKDISKEIDVERIISRQNDWFKITLASICDSVLTTDTDGTINYSNTIANQVLCKGFSFCGKPLIHSLKILDPVTREAGSFRKPHELEEGVLRHENILVLPDGVELHVEISHAPILSPRGELHGAVLVIHDVSEIRTIARELMAATKQAESALKAQSIFLATMSHEIRTPINGIVGMADLLKDTKMTKAQHEAVDIIRISNEALLALVNDILDYSKIEAGKLEIETITFDLRKTIEDAGDLMNQTARNKGLGLAIIIHPDVPAMAIGDGKRLNQIMLNFLSNAIKFTEDGDVALEVYRVEQAEGFLSIQIDVSDTGIGIPANRLEHLFEPFTQADTSITRKYGGTGLGLTICKKLTEAMGGRIWPSSTVGKGSTFSCTIELGREPSKKTEVLGATPRVLLAIPTPQTRKSIFYQLEYLGAIITEDECNIEETLLLAEENGHSFHYLFLDLSLSSLDSIVNRIQKNSHLKGLKIILIDARVSTVKKRIPSVHSTLSSPIRLQTLCHCLNPLESSKQEGENRKGANFYFPTARVLVVDNDRVNQIVITRLLQQAGIVCKVVGDGLKAVSEVRNSSYHLVLMDCQMPVMDGYLATKQIRKNEKGGHLPIIAMTASALDGDRDKCLEAGMDDYLTKPIRKSVLYDTLSAYLLEERN